MAAAVLFGDDVTVPLDEVEKAINRKSQLLLDLRLADEFEKEIADRIQSESFNIVMLKGDILKAITASDRADYDLHGDAHAGLSRGLALFFDVPLRPTGRPT